MTDGRPGATRMVIEIRIEKRETDQSKNPGSVIPFNPRAKFGDEILWFVSERVSPELPSTPPKEDPSPVKARRLKNVVLRVIFKGNPFDARRPDFVSEREGLLTAKVQVEPPAGQELVYHYGVEVTENGKVIFRDVHCPEIIIQR